MLENLFYILIIGGIVSFLLLSGMFLILQYPFAKMFLNFFDKNKNCFIERSKRKQLSRKYAFAYKIPNIFFNDIIDKFKTLYSEMDKTIDEHNCKFAESEKKRYKVLFSSIDNKRLDDQQQNVCVRSENSTLVVAGAGSGKTLTICGKVKYLIEKNISPDKILLISFTNKACNELQERLEKITNKRLNVLTFHKFALQIIKNYEKVKIADENKSDKIIKDIFLELVKTDPMFSTYLLRSFAEQLKEKIKEKQIDQTVPKTEKQDLQPDLTFDTLKNNMDLLDDFVNNKTKTRKLETYKKENVKSSYEQQIADLLFVLGVRYEYESFYKLDPDQEYEDWLHTYKPDFYLPDYDIYIEHFGVNRFGNADWIKDELKRKDYKRKMKTKIAAHKKHGTTLICTYSYFRDKLPENLIDLLNKKNVKMNSRIAEFLEKIEEAKEIDFIHNRLKIFSTFIKLFKNNDYRDSKFREFQQSEFILMVESIYRKYQQSLKLNGWVDFEDIINIANAKLRKTRKQTNYKYILVDEYQDVSKNKVVLLNQLIRIHDCKLLCLGDDWQSIYRFAGSDTNLFTEFGSYIKNSEVLKIEKTYRNCQELIKATSTFIQQNPSQIKKQLISVKHIAKPILIEYIQPYDFKDVVNLSVDDTKKIDKCPKLQYITNDPRIRELKKFLEYATTRRYKNILVLGRNNFNLDILEALPFAMPADFIRDKNTSDSIVLNYKSITITCLTMHKSKGLEADAVVIWDMKEGIRGLPDTKGEDNCLSEVLTRPDKISYGEDRRLFYVALTRTKNEVLIITLFDNTSRFVRELENAHPEVIGSKKAICQKCGAEMNLYEKYNFYGCSNRKITGCDYKIQNADKFLYFQKYPKVFYKTKPTYTGKEPITLLNTEKSKRDIKDSKPYEGNSKNDEFVCGWLVNALEQEWLKNGGYQIIAAEKRKKREEESKRIAELRKKVRKNCWVDITHPSRTTIWKIKILPVYYTSKPVFTGKRNGGNRIGEQRERITEANLKENTIAEDTPLAMSLLGKTEGEEYSFIVEGEKTSGQIIKIYNKD